MRMIRTTKRASERRGAEVAMLRTAVHGRGTRQCLERARAANIAARNESRREKRGALAKWERRTPGEWASSDWLSLIPTWHAPLWQVQSFETPVLKLSSFSPSTVNSPSKARIHRRLKITVQNAISGQWSAMSDDSDRRASTRAGAVCLPGLAI